MTSLVRVNRTCKKCSVDKELNAENFRSNGHTGFRHDCRECERGLVAQYRIDNPEKVADATRKWNKNNRAKLNAQKKVWRKNNLDKHNATRRKCTYGISDVEFKGLFTSQNGKCAICDFVFPGMQTGDRNLSPHVDHCHETGKIRGLLCNSCNTGLGRFKDSTDLLQKATSYLQKSSV